MGVTQGSFARSALVVVFMICLVLGIGDPASACTCGGQSVTETVRRADAVYIGTARTPDLWPGVSFRVSRSLKGPARANVRAPVERGPEASCGTIVGRSEYLLVFRDDRPLQLSLCTEHLRGPDAVREAQTELGKGTPAAWRPDLRWSIQWLLLVVGALSWTYFRRREWKRAS